MKKLFVCGASVLSLSAALAVPPTIPENSVTVTENSQHRLFVNYTLENGPAIVTFEVLTNGVSIGEAPLANATGDVNRKVESGAHSFSWKTTKGWPGYYFPKGGDVTVSVKVVAWDVACAPNVMVIDLLSQSNVTYYVSFDGLPGGIQDDVYKTDKLVLRRIPAEYVTWKMGSPTTEAGYNSYDDKLHSVTLTSDYYIGVYEVTQKQWYNIKGNRPSYYNNDSCWEKRPVEKVGYEIADRIAGVDRGADIRGSHAWPTGDDPHVVNANSFFGILRAWTGLTGLDLPTDAQWEYACRAGSGTAYYNGLAYGADNLKTLARYRDNAYVEGTTAPAQDCTTEYGTAAVGSYLPNTWGLYDMLGNVSELCLDRWTQWGFDAQTDPVGTAASDQQEYHVFRGGSCMEKITTVRCGARGSWWKNLDYQVDASMRIWEVKSYIGFRVCLHLQ